MEYCCVFKASSFDLQPEDEIKIYIWNKEKNNFLIDDYCISADHGDNPYTEK